MEAKPQKRSLEQEVEAAIQAGFEELLEYKHLYQSVTINLEPARACLMESERAELNDRLKFGSHHDRLITEKEIKEVEDEVRKRLVKRLSRWSNDQWILIDDRISETNFRLFRERVESGAFVAPPVSVCCSKCKSGPWPHNPAGEIGANGYPFVSVSPLETGIQVFLLSYLCQNCRKEQVCFSIKREGLKLTLVGRSQFPETIVPDFIPEYLRKFYRNAIIADQTSFTLAAALYLRTVIEQHFYQTVPDTEIKTIRGNPTGDELAELYAKTLPKSFPDSFPSLKKAYGDLSVIVHSGIEDEATKKSFVAIRLAVDGHFKAIQLFKEMPTQ